MSSAVGPEPPPQGGRSAGPSLASGLDRYAQAVIRAGLLGFIGYGGARLSAIRISGAPQPGCGGSARAK